MNRRRFVLVAGTAGMVGVAGCLGFGDDENGDGDDENGNGDANGDENGDEPSELDAAFSVAPVEPLDGQEVTLDASASTGNIEAFRWDLTGDGETDETGETVSYVPEAGATVTLEVEGTDGETATTTEEIEVRSESIDDVVPVAFTWNVQGEDELVVDAAGTESTVGEIVEYRWEFIQADTTTETTTDPVARYEVDTDAGLQVRLEVEDSEGNVNSTTEVIAESPAISLSVALDPADPAAGEQVTFDASASTGDIETFRWDFTGDGAFDAVTDGPTTTHTFPEDGIYEVTLEAEGPAGVRRQTTELPVGVPPLEAAFGWDPQNPDPGEEVTFDAGPTPGDVQTYRWDFTGDGAFDTTSDEPTTTHTFPEEGEFGVVLEIERPAGTAAVGAGITVGDPEPDILVEVEVTPENPDPGEEVTFDASGSTGDIEAFQWDFTGDRETDATGVTVTHVFEDAGLNPVEVTAVGAERTTRETIGVEVGDTDEGEIDARFEWTPETPAVGEEVTFDASDSVSEDAPIEEYIWGSSPSLDFEAETTEPTVTHTFEQAEPGTIALIVVNAEGQSDAREASIEVVES